MLQRCRKAYKRREKDGVPHSPNVFKRVMKNMHTIRIDTKAITKTWAIALAGIIIIAAVACGSAYYYLVPPASEQTIKIGAPFPMTGDAMFYGENCLKIIQMLADDINAQGGILGKKVEIVVEDGKCDPPAGLTAIQRLIYTDKVDLMFGAICSSIGLAAGPQFNRQICR